MKKFLLLLSISCFCLSSTSQNNYGTSNLFEGLKSYEPENSKNVTRIEGNGYEIIVRNTEEKLKPIQKLQSEKSIADQFDKFAKTYHGGYDEKSETDGFYVYADNANTVKKTSYVYTSNDDKFKIISFIKSGISDETYELEIVRYIRANGVPVSVFVNRQSPTGEFAGKKINLPESYRFTGVNELRNKNYYPLIKWDEYSSLEEAEAAKTRAIIELKSRWEERIADESQDSVLFLGQKVLADKISYYGSAGGRYKFINFSDYFVVGQTENKNFFLNATIVEDDLADRTKLPDFISENFFQTLKPRKLFELQENGIPRQDTIYIAKKKRGPIWHYYDQNTTIIGLSVGFGTFKEIKNVTTNGIKLEVPGSSIAAVFGLPYMFFPPGMLGGRSFEQEIKERKEEAQRTLLEYKNRMDITNGLNISLTGSLGTNNRISNGVEIIGIMGTNYKMNGVSIVGILRSSAIANGISIAGITNANYISNGIHIAGLWTQSYEMNGIHIAGIHSMAVDATGLQISIYNGIQNSMRGVQIGGYNKANEIQGLQIGIFNSAKKLKGLQLGLINKSEKRTLPFINWGF